MLQSQLLNGRVQTARSNLDVVVHQEELAIDVLLSQISFNDQPLHIGGRVARAFGAAKALLEPDMSVSVINVVQAQLQVSLRNVRQQVRILARLNKLRIFIHFDEHGYLTSERRRIRVLDDEDHARAVWIRRDLTRHHRHHRQNRGLISRQLLHLECEEAEYEDVD